MRIAIPPAQSRYLALALFVLAVALAATAIAIPTWRLHQHYDQHIEDYSDQLLRYRRVAALRPHLEEAIAVAERDDIHKYYLKATTATLAAAELQGLLTRIVESRQGRISSSQMLANKDDSNASASNPVKVSMTIQLTAATVPLQLILHAIETSEPYLLVDQLTVRAAQGRGYKPVPGVQPEFNVQITVSAYALPAGGQP